MLKVEFSQFIPLSLLPYGLIWRKQLARSTGNPLKVSVTKRLFLNRAVSRYPIDMHKLEAAQVQYACCVLFDYVIRKSSLLTDRAGLETTHLSPHVGPRAHVAMAVLPAMHICHWQCYRCA
jgi:hypothetical protein